MPPILALDDFKVIAQGVDHPEGVCAINDTLYVSGEKGQLYRIDDQSKVTEILTTGGFLLGLAADRDGQIYACDAGHACVWRIDPTRAVYDLFTRGTETSPMAVPNWPSFGPDGSLFVTDSGRWKALEGRIFVVRPSGRTELWTTESAAFPNGCAVTPDGSELWVLESNTPCLSRIAIRADGSAGKRSVVAALPGTVPDGLAFAADGSVLIACYRPDAILRWHPSSGLEVLAADPEGAVLAAPTNIAFFGPKLELAAVPNIAARFVTIFRPGVLGAPLHRPAGAHLAQARPA
jgi:gluconolactonase